ncbi:MAG: urea ABC transporter permease subunit UrtB [Nitrospirae bacterium]|nr:MAG: urea ABC transporter permease subunit UrtB [Nitrospirota bacterium]
MLTKPSTEIRLGRLGWTIVVCLLTSAFLLGKGIELVYAEGPVTAESGRPNASSYMQGLASLDPTIQVTTLKALGDMNDIAFLPALTALNEGTLHVWKDAPGSEKVIILLRNIEPDGRETISFMNPLTGEELGKRNAAEALPEGELEMVAIRSVDGRRVLKAGLDRLRLFDPTVEVRRTTATKLGNAKDLSVLPALDQALSRESDKWVRHAIEEAINQLRLTDPDPEVRRAAAIRLGEIKGMRALPHMKALLTEEPLEPSDTVRGALQKAIDSIESYQSFQNVVGITFNGLSLGSILFIMGLGLAITYGLMGVINMAHGEMMMIGAYTAFILQEAFFKYLPPSLHDSYFIFALPAAFVVTGAVGLLLERTVIRFLYGKPLETLLATWGVSMFLQQAARWYFGDLTSVNAPKWMRGGMEPMVGLVLPYSRIFIIGLAAAALLGVYLLLSQTRMGLLVRAVTQNRNMSACVGISTRKVDSWTFAFGTALAGIAGCAISLIGSVDPEVGKSYIVESFMIVVVGGVGKLAGTVVSAMGIGMLNKILEPLIGGTGGAVYGKLFILLAIILFLQIRPTGLFPAKGRVAD